MKEPSLDDLGTISTLCHPENQPHQWVSDPSKLLGDLFGCREDAEWAIYDRDPYAETYTCTEHLSKMVSDTTVEMRCAEEGSKCCFIAHPETDEASNRLWELVNCA